MSAAVLKRDTFVSVVTLLEGDAGETETCLRALHAHLHEHFEDYEILLLDRGANEATRDRVEQLLSQIPSVRYLKLAFRVHADIALAAGLENAIGDCVVLFDGGADPVDCIREIVERCLKGHDIVIGVSAQNQTTGYRLVRPFIRWMLGHIGYNVPRNATGLRCMSRRAVNAVTRTGRFHHQLYVRINNTGYPFTVYPYEQKRSAGSERTLHGGIRQGIHLLVFNSTKPLRWMSGLGLLGSLLAFMFSLYSLLIRYFKESVIEGWTTMVLFSSMLFMILFVILAFLGEYLARLLDERNDQNDYTVAFEKTSSVMLNEQRENVIKA